MWATSLPCDLLVDIFRRLGSTAVIRCAGVCKPWRRAIIDNVSCLQPRPDRFLPDLLLGFLDTSWRRRVREGRVEYVSEAGPLGTNVIALEGVDVRDDTLRLLASRDGFLLFCAADSAVPNNNSLCLYNHQAGSCRLLPAATLQRVSSGECKYVVVTGCDDDDGGGGGGGGPCVRILAVARQENFKDGMMYQVFSSTSGAGAGAWGPVKRSEKIIDYRVRAYKLTHEEKNLVVCDGGSVVYWLAYMITLDGNTHTRLFGIELRTGRTWTAELPGDCEMSRNHCCPSEVVLATTEDGRLSLIRVRVRPRHRQIDVWVLVDDDSRWTLQRTMDVQSMLPNYPDLGFFWISGFCPRSGRLFGFARDKDYQGVLRRFVDDVDGSSPRLTERVDDPKYCNNKLPYEMAWSTYISKMKYF